MGRDDRRGRRGGGLTVPGVTLEGVTKEYPGGVTAVDNISLVIEEGEFVTLVGPSGCGKTTTLRTIAGFEQATAGTVGIAGMEVNNTPPDGRDTGMVFQDFALFPHMTVAENIAYGLEVRGEDDETIDARVQEMLELVELPETADRKPTQLSGGQQQRIAVARAVAPKPSVLLLDEPLASLDKKLRETMQVELSRIQKQLGITTLLVTHNQKEALTMSDRVVVMNDGEFEQVDTPEAVYSNPASPFVADFIGNANLFDGSVVASTDSGKTTINCGGITLQANTSKRQQLGENVTVMIRPENIDLADQSVATDGGEAITTIDGTVTFTQFGGGQTEFFVETEAGQEITSIQQSEHTTLKTGDHAELLVRSSDVLVFPNT